MLRVAVAGLLAGLATGCTSSPPAAPPLPTTAASASRPDPSQFTPAPTGVPEDWGTGQPDTTRGASPSTTAATSTDPKRTDALAVATDVMRLFARRNVSADQWIKDLTPYMTEQAAQAYAGTDPANVRATKVTGPATLVPTDSKVLSRVHVPTDAGTYLVIMRRTADDPTWRVERITPPEKYAGN